VIIRFFISALIGFVCHQSARVTKKMPVGWRNLTDHTIGMVTVTPLTIWWWGFLHHDEASQEQIRHEILSATGLASLGYGIGNALAWIMDAVSDDE
jgi:hypothetical protein